MPLFTPDIARQRLTHNVIINHQESAIYQLLELLSDGNFHSGEALSQTLSLSRTSIWNQIQRLEESGVAIYRVKGKGYRLARPMELLKKEQILDQLNPIAANKIAQLDVFSDIDSTNRYLMRQAQAGAASGHVALAEAQSDGKGRHGKTWQSPLGSNLYLSLLWRYPGGAQVLGGMSLLVGLSITMTLERLGCKGIGIKWPNDLLWQQRKLAGILLEVGGESNGPCFVIVGIGINVNFPKIDTFTIDQPWVDLSEIKPSLTSRNQLASELLNDLVPLIAQYDREGLKPHLAAWRQRDAFNNQPVRLFTEQFEVTGTSQGIDASGAIQLETDGTIKSYPFGEVSLRGMP